MKTATKKPGGWSAVRQQLATWEKPALLALLKDLYEAAAENRDFIHARSKAGECGGEARGMYPQFRDRLARVEQMTDGIGWGFHDFVGDVVGQLEEELGG